MGRKQDKADLLDKIYSDSPNKVHPAWITPSGETPSEFEPIDLESLSGIAETLNDIAEVMQNVVNAAEPLIAFVDATDPIETAINLLASSLNDTIDSILQTGLFLYPILPKPKITAFFQPYSTDQAYQDIIASVSDTLDSERPKGPETSAYAGVVVLAGTNEYADFITLIRLFQGLFGDLSKFARLADIWEAYLDEETLEEKSISAFRATEGVPYDWTSFRLEEVDAINRSLLQLKSMINVNIGGLGSALQDTVRILKKRIEYILRIINEAAKLAEFLSIINQIRAKCLILPIASQSGGAGGMVSDIINADNKPDFEFCVGFIATGFGPDLTFSSQVQKFLALWGATTENFNAMLEQSERAREGEDES